MVYVTFKCQGRFGNLLFQYLMCKIFTIEHGHEYIIEDDFLLKTANVENTEIITDSNVEFMLKNNKDIMNKNIYCQGYFQNSDLFNSYRKKLIDIVNDENNKDYWVDNNKKTILYEYLNGNHSLSLSPNDIVVSLRLDDFIQYPRETSDILPPQYYIEILEKMNINNEKVYIVCDKLTIDWEFKYIEHFQKWNPVIIQNTLVHDISLMRDCNNLIHSNSTLCWLVSFLSNKKQRFIPKTFFYSNQNLNKIEDGDKLFEIQPLDHDEVHNLNVKDFKILPLSFSIPDECVVISIPEKERLLANLIPGDTSTYIFGIGEEDKYYDMYRKSRFALTKMKGGWDCLRHYEILMNGCIPLFENLKECPDYTMTTYPKHLNNEAYNLYNNWSETSDNISKYNDLCNRFLDHTRKYCTSSYAAKIVLDNIKNSDKIKNILMIRCNSGFNYSREFTWIGLKRHIQSLGGVAVEYPKINILYEDYNIHLSNKCEYTYPRRLKNDYDMGESEIIDKIRNNFWDLIIYGKVGPDEYCDFPLYDIVKKKYNRNKIAFIYGGDEIFNLKVRDKRAYHINMFGAHIPYYPYVDYLNYYKQFGTCFVRELEM